MSDKKTEATDAEVDTPRCWAIYHAGERQPGSLMVAFCWKPESEHPACGHDFQAEYDDKCACGRIHNVSEFPK